MPLHLPLGFLRQSVPTLDQFFGLWAVESDRFLQMLETVRAMDLVRHVGLSAFDGQVDAERARAVIVRADLAAGHGPHGEPQAADGYDDVTVRDGREIANIAVVRLVGTMTKQGSSLSSAGSSVRVRSAIRKAAANDDVDGILLVVDSPGGTVAGTADLAAEVARAAVRKPVFGFGEDLVASAAYWTISQASEVYANDPTAMVGSIGTYVGLYDLSRYAAKEGIQAVIIKAGEFKGTGFPGAEITDEQKAYWQELVDKTQESFTAGVARCRRMKTSAVPVTGKVYMARDAQGLGLIDGIQSFEATLEGLAVAAMRARRSAGRSANVAGAQVLAHDVTIHQIPPVDMSQDTEKHVPDSTSPNSTSSAEREEARQEAPPTSGNTSPASAGPAASDDATEPADDATPDQPGEDAPEDAPEDTPDDGADDQGDEAPDDDDGGDPDDQGDDPDDAREDEPNDDPEGDPEASASAAAPGTQADDVAALRARLAELEARDAEHTKRLAEQEAAARRAGFEAFARENRTRILPGNEARAVAVMEALHGQAEALETFRAFVAALPVQYAPNVMVTLGAPKAGAEEPVTNLPAGAIGDPAQVEAVARIKAYAAEHGISFREAVAVLGDAALTGLAE